MDVDWNGIFKSFYELIRVKVAYRDPLKIPFKRLVEMKRKLYLLFFAVEGFEQVGEDSGGDDDDPDKDKQNGKNVDKEPDATNKDKLDEDDEEPIDELDKANFPKKGASSGASKSKQVSAVSAMDFHPYKFLDSCHEHFIEEAKNKNPIKTATTLEDPVSPTCDNVLVTKQETDPMSAHMEYCSEQLRKFEMADLDGEEEENMIDEMQCLPKDLALAIRSVKRSLLESLEKAESEKRMKSTKEPAAKWGLVLSNRPVTRNHGNIKVMDKATAYMQKKNLEIPASFKGKSFATLALDELANQSSQVDLCIGDCL